MDPRATDIDIYYCETPDFTVEKTHYHNVHQIILVIAGAARFDIDAKSYTVRQNAVVCISNLEKHSVKILESPYKRYVLSLPQDFGHGTLSNTPLLSIVLQRPESFSHVIGLDDEISHDIRLIFEAMLAENTEKKAFWSLRCDSLAADLLIRLYRYSSSSFPGNETNDAINIVTRVQNHIIQNADREITLEDMAKQNYISKYYLSRIFKEVTGYTFKDYLILHRLSIAKDLLLHSDKTVTDVCLLSGYNNVNHFIRSFKNLEGVTPYQYKKTHARH